MRKIEFKKFIHFIIFITILSLLTIGLGIIIKVGFNMLSFLLILGLIAFWSLIILSAILINKLINYFYYKNHDQNIYYRDIPNEYTLAIASLIYDKFQPPC